MLIAALTIGSCSTDSIPSTDQVLTPCITEYTVASCNNGGSFGGLGDVRSMIFSIENINDDEVCGPVTVLLILPDTDLLQASIPEVSNTIDICGFILPTNNEDWDYTYVGGNLVYLVSNTDIIGSSIIEISFECIEYVQNETTQFLGTIIMGSGGDTNPNNNTFQYTFVLN